MEEKDLDREYTGRRYGRRSISFYPRRGGLEEEEAVRRDLLWVGAEGGGGREIGGSGQSRPRKNNLSERWKEGAEFLRMQLWRPQISRRQQKITAGTIYFRLPGGEERTPRGRGRRCPCSTSAGREADTETAREMTTGIRTDISLLGVPGGRGTKRANQLRCGWQQRRRWIEVNSEVTNGSRGN